MDLDVNYATTLVAAVLLGTGFVLQQYAAEQEPESRFLSPRILTDLLRKPRWLLGIACMVSGYLVAAWSIGHLELTLVEPLLTTYLVWALVLAVPMSKQSVKLAEVAGAVVLCGGVALLSLSRSTKPIGLSFGSFSHWPAAAIIAGIAFISVEVGHRGSGQVRATLVGLGAGLVFGIQDALTRQTLEILQGHPVTVLFTNWPPYCLIAAGVVGIWLMQNAFSAGPLHYSLPTIAAGEPVAGIALGIVVFGDRIQVTPGMLAIEAGGIAALIVGTVAVARSSAFGGLRKISKITDVILPGSEPAGGSPDKPASARAHPQNPAEPSPARNSSEPSPARNSSEPSPARNSSEPSPARNSAEPAHVHPTAMSPAQRLSRALATRRHAPGQASGGDGG